MALRKVNGPKGTENWSLHGCTTPPHSPGPPLVTAEERAASPTTSSPTPRMGLTALQDLVQGLPQEITAGTTVVDSSQ